ncbi:MAG: hypothetical protein Q4C49_05570 [Bacillota bacterium]|nr:hypothetical protein [Bacillota bacterium]
MEKDQTIYKIILEPGNVFNRKNVEVLAKITGENYADIKRYIESAPVILVKDHAAKIVEIRQCLIEHQIVFSIEPDFKY